MAKIDTQKYQEMQAAYLEHQTADYVSKKCHVAYVTAKKYIEHGDPKRGLVALRVIAKMAAERAAELAVDSAAIDYNKFQSTAKNILENFESRLQRVSVADLKELMDLLERIEEKQSGSRPESKTEIGWVKPHDRD